MKLAEDYAVRTTARFTGQFTLTYSCSGGLRDMIFPKPDLLIESILLQLRFEEMASRCEEQYYLR